jgi:hypothetical protein
MGEDEILRFGPSGHGPDLSDRRVRGEQVLLERATDFGRQGGGEFVDPDLVDDLVDEVVATLARSMRFSLGAVSPEMTTEPSGVSNRYPNAGAVGW